MVIKELMRKKDYIKYYPEAVSGPEEHVKK